MDPGRLPVIVAVITCGPCWLVWAVHYLCRGASCTILIKVLMANMVSWLVFLHASGIKPSILFTCLEDSELQQLYFSVEFYCAHHGNINGTDILSTDAIVTMQPCAIHHECSGSSSNLGCPWTDWERLSRGISNYAKCSRISPDHWLRQSEPPFDSGNAAEWCLGKLTDQCGGRSFCGAKLSSFD